MDKARQFALRSLDRVLAQGWNDASGLTHVLAYSDADADHRRVPGVLDDYAFTAVACLDAYEVSADLSYFNFARRIADMMINRFFDTGSGGFFDTQKTLDQKLFGVLGTPRKPFQDSPTPAGNSMAAIALLRLHGYTGESQYREKAARTIEVLAGVGGQYGIFVATYGVAGMLLSRPHMQVVVVGNDEPAEKLYAAALAPFSIGKSVLKLAATEAISQNLPPALAETIPQLPAIKQAKSIAVICSDFSCRPPIFEPCELIRSLQRHEAAA